MSAFNILAAIYMSLVSIVTIFGNGLVILTWIFYPDIRTPRNLYLVSLATVDLLTGLFQMPLLIGYGISETWPFGQVLCLFYIYHGWVLISASVFHLIAIAIDTYQVAYDGVSYIQRRTLKSVLLRIGFIWVFSIWQMAPTIFSLEQISGNLDASSKCASIPSQAARFHMCFGVFYFPVVIISMIYHSVYKEISRRIRKKLPNSARLESIQDPSSADSALGATVLTTDDEFGVPCDVQKNEKSNTKKITTEREHKAAKTLGIIIGAFVFSWMPFFIMYPTIGLLPNGLRPPPEVFVTILAIGFTNSAMNPIIYTFYNQDFRSGFNRMFSWRS